MRATLAFDVNDHLDEATFREHLDGPTFKLALQDLAAELRQQLKYGNPPCDLEAFARHFHEAMAERRINLD